MKEKMVRDPYLAQIGRSGICGNPECENKKRVGKLMCPACRRASAERLGITERTARNYENRLLKEANEDESGDLL
jgi:hypothetical protein